MTTAQETEVLIVGAGPAGLLLACELRLAGVNTVLIERQPTRPSFCRGFNLNARSLDLLARRGLADQLIAEGWQVSHAAFSGLPVTLGLAGTHTDHPFSLGIPQTRVEEILEAHALKLGLTLPRGHELRAFTQDEHQITATVATSGGERRFTASFLVGCDGGRSTVRKHAQIPFPGTEAKRFTLLGDVELADPTDLGLGITTGPGGSVLAIPRPGYVRLLTTDPAAPPDTHTPVTLDQLSNAVDRALGRHVELRAPRWLTRFGDAARQASRYVDGRVILAGDAAHIHPPAGAIGVNVALDDAFNLGWKLAATVRGDAPDHLLHSYHHERHDQGARVLAQTRAQVMLAEADEATNPLHGLIGRLARHPLGNRALAETITGLDTRYEMPHAPDTHPWLGRLAPDLPLTTEHGDTSLAALLTDGRALLLDLTPPHRLRNMAAGWSDRVTTIVAQCSDTDLDALLVRPDGHVAWLSTASDDEPSATLHAALRHWHGTPQG